jgi:hypothetical protein
MPNSQRTPAGPSFEQFMKACYQSPEFFESMKGVYMNNMEAMQSSGASNASSANSSLVYSQTQPTPPAQYRAPVQSQP